MLPGRRRSQRKMDWLQNREVVMLREVNCAACTRRAAFAVSSSRRRRGTERGFMQLDSHRVVSRTRSVRGGSRTAVVCVAPPDSFWSRLPRVLSGRNDPCGSKLGSRRTIDR